MATRKTKELVEKKLPQTTENLVDDEEEKRKKVNVILVPPHRLHRTIYL